MKFAAVLLFLCMVLIAGNAGAETLYEESLRTMGFESFTSSEIGNSACTDYVFLFPAETDVQGAGNFAVFSMMFSTEKNTDVKPTAQNTSLMEFRLNAEKFLEFNEIEIACGSESCWKRITLPKEVISGENTLHICALPTEQTTEISISNTSLLGIYRMPNFEKEDFTKTPATVRPLHSDELEITIRIKNSGSEPADVHVNYLKEVVEERMKITAFNVLRGNSEWEGVIEAGAEEILTYSIKPTVLGGIILPAAEAIFTNVFGEEVRIVSNYPVMTVTEPEQKIEAVIIKDMETIKVGEIFNLELIVKNNGKSPLFNIAADLVIPEGVTLIGNEKFTIDAIQPSESKTFSFGVSAGEAGSYELGCELIYLNLEVDKSSCEITTVSFEDLYIDVAIIGGLLLALIGAFIYLYLRYGD